MKKSKMYGMLSFIIFTFLFVTVVLILEFGGILSKEKDVLPPTSVEVGDTEGEKEDLEDSTDKEQGNEEGKNEDEAVNPGEEEDTDEEIGGDISMVFAGDIYLSDYVTKAYDKDGIDGILSKELQDEFIGADIAMANQEFAFSTRGEKAPNKQFTFRVNPSYGTAFRDMGLDIVTLANNHSMDFGREALLDSFDTLNQLDILYVGAGKDRDEAKTTRYMEVKGKTIAFLAASRVIPVPEWNAGTTSAGLFTTYDPTELIEEIKTAREISDYVVVYVHWGIERDTRPQTYQRNMGKQYIDAGADLVIGSHPHVLQGVEYYNGKPIVYSLGNFMFYNEIKQTALLKVTLKEEEAEISLLPCKASGGRTYLQEGEWTEFDSYMEGISYDVKYSNGLIIPLQ